MFRFENVLIIGAGIGGLAAAAAVAPYARSVTLLDKDSWSDRSGVRKAIPQGAHIHILLRAGLNMLDRLLPGIAAQLEAQGAAKIVAGLGQQIHEFGAWQPSRALDLHFLAQSRPFLERLVHDAVVALDNVTIRQGCTVTDLSFSDERVEVKLQGGETCVGDLLIDAAGVGRPLLRLLTERGLAVVPTDASKIGIFYATVHFHKMPAWRGIHENILIIPDPAVSELGGSLITVEQEKWCVSLHGRRGAKPPADIEGWRTMAQSLSDQRIWNRISEAEPAGELSLFRKPVASWSRFDKADELPLRYLPLGDTITSVNPIYGQGMTVALGHASALRRCLAESPDSPEVLQKRYIAGASEWSALAWKKAANFDRHYIDDSSESASKIEIVRKLTLAQHRRAEADADFHLKMAAQAQMLDAVAGH